MSHDGGTCKKGHHSNRGKVIDMCPTFLRERRRLARDRYEAQDWVEREDNLQRTNRNTRKRNVRTRKNR